MDESIGAKLRQARERRRLNLQQVSESTKVRPHYLQALENDDLSAIPSAAQARGFLGIYAGFLGLDLAELVPAVRPAEPAPPVATPTDSPAIETPNPQAARHFGVLAWAGERWSQLGGKLQRAQPAVGPDRSAPSAASIIDPLAESGASKTDSSAQSAGLKTDRSTQAEPSKTDPRKASLLNAEDERIAARSKTVPPLESRIREMFLETTVERVSSSAEAAGKTPSQPESGPRGAASSPPLPAHTKKKVVM